ARSVPAGDEDERARQIFTERRLARVLPITALVERLSGEVDRDGEVVVHDAHEDRAENVGHEGRARSPRDGVGDALPDRAGVVEPRGAGVDPYVHLVAGT